MIINRRNFIRSTSATALVTALLPSLTRLEKIRTSPVPVGLPRMSPESQGIASAAILQLVKAMEASGLEWHSFMLLRHGNVVAEGWWKPFEASFKHTLYSLSKSFTSTAIGLLVKEGKITVEDPVTSFFKDELPVTISANLAEMKVRHLLTMNTGHGEDTMPKLRESGDTWTRTFLAQPVNFKPGSHFLYNTGATYMLGAIVYRVTGETLEQFLGSRLFRPLDIKEYDWETSPQGLNTAGFGLRVKTEDIARLGQLYLQKGKWDGKQILSENWVQEATSYQTSSNTGDGDWAQGYGYQFWRCKPGFYRGDGAFGQFCIVMPEQDAVLAITSESWDMQKSMTTIWNNLLPAIQPGSLPDNPAAWNELQKALKNLSLPVPTGAVTSSQAARYHDKKIKLEKNEYGVTDAQFRFTDKACYLTIVGKEQTIKLQFGWENWLLNPEEISYPFPVANRIHVPSSIAGTATWTDDHTLQLSLKFAEAIHGDTITCVFGDDTVNFSFLNSIARNTKNNPEKRKGITGKL